MGIEVTKEQYIENGMNDWPFMQVMVIQHFAGAMLCVPSLVGWGSVEWSSSIAALGILSEMGWELEQ